MSNTDTHTTGAHGASSAGSAVGSHAVTNGRTAHGVHAHAEPRRVSTETRASFKTTGLIAYVAAVIAVLVLTVVSLQPA